MILQVGNGSTGHDMFKGDKVWTRFGQILHFDIMYLMLTAQGRIQDTRQYLQRRGVQHG